jgi:hypothetical protein
LRKHSENKPVSSILQTRQGGHVLIMLFKESEAFNRYCLSLLTSAPSLWSKRACNPLQLLNLLRHPHDALNSSLVIFIVLAIQQLSQGLTMVVLPISNGASHQSIATLYLKFRETSLTNMEDGRPRSFLTILGSRKNRIPVDFKPCE